MKNATREEILELWLTTLEQHPERQTTGVLGEVLEEGKEKFCCLGQLCEIYYDSSIKIVDKNSNITFNGEDIALPSDLQNFMGFYGDEGLILGEQPEKDGTTFNTLTEMNDDGCTWPEIAAFIRANPEQVFDR